MKLDKILHFTVSYALVITLALRLPLVIAASVSVLIGTLKEVYDYYHPAAHTADWYDFFADSCGVLAAVAVLVLHRNYPQQLI